MTPGERAPRAARARLRRWPEVALFVGGLLLVGSSVAVRLERAAYQHTGMAHAGHYARGAPIGRLEIPRLELSVMIAEGTDPRTLDRAVGHVRGTAIPGAEGNVAIAGHRDTFFRRLRSLERGDRIRITGDRGTFTYRVTSTAVLGPDRVDVIHPTGLPALTLVTCYPFHAIGPAPKRYVVRALAIDGLAQRTDRPTPAKPAS